MTDNATTVQLPRVTVASRAARAAAAVRPWWLAAGTAVDRYDTWCLASLAGLLWGLTVWVGFGPAMTIVMVLCLTFGVAAARKAKQAAADEEALQAAHDAAFHSRPRLED